MNKCKCCGSTDMLYVTNYEHLDFESGDSCYDDGYECQDCNCFHDISGEYFEFFGSYEEPTKVNYNQIMCK